MTEIIVLTPVSIPWSIYQTYKKRHIAINALKYFIKVRIFFFFTFNNYQKKLKNYYGPFLKKGNVFYRVSSITNFSPRL